ncbi:MAG: tyrosine-type recombinase/integrase [Rhodoglobus sp.]
MPLASRLPALYSPLDPHHKTDYAVEKVCAAPRHRGARRANVAGDDGELDQQVVVANRQVDFRFHDLRHYLASMLIASGADVKVAQARLHHASAKTTLDTYAHLWPDSDESTCIAIDAVMQERAEAIQSAESESL